MHLYLQLTRSLAVTLIWLYCNKLVLRYVRLRVSDLGQVSIPQPGIVTVEDYHTCSGIFNEPVNAGMNNAGKSTSGIYDVYFCLP